MISRMVAQIIRVHHFVRGCALLFVRLGLAAHAIVVDLNVLLIVPDLAEKNVTTVVQISVLVVEENASEDAHLVMDALVV